MLECEHRTADKRLSELVTEIGSTVRCLCQYLLRSLIEPLAHGENLLPLAVGVCTGIRCHVHCSSGNGPRALTATHTVAYFTARTCRSTVERLNSCREIMSLGLERDNCFYVLYYEIIGYRVVGRSELLDNRTLCKCHVVLVCRYYAVAVLVCGAFYHCKER